MDINTTFLARLSDISYLDLTLTQWLILLGLAFALWAIARFALSKVIKHFGKIARNSASQWDDVIVTSMQRTHGLVIFFLTFYAAAMLVGAPVETRAIFYKFVVIGVFFQAAIWGNQFVEYWLRRYLMKRQHMEADEKVDLAAYSAISVTGKFVLWSVLFLLLLDNLGVNITALVTGLGIGGIAIALAAQNVLGDIFASLSIVMDRPFEIGDLIVVGDKWGTVENIGLKTSRLKSLSGEQLVFPNKTLIESQISNFKRMQTRRIVFTFSVVNTTPIEKLRAIPGIIKDIVASIQDCTFDRAHFSKFTESALEFEVVYIMLVPEVNSYMDTQQAINLQLYERFGKQGIDFAIPSRTVILQTASDNRTKKDKDTYVPASVVLRPDSATI